MAARLANVVMTEIIPHCNHIVDLHTGAVNRENLPQIRARLVDDPDLEKLARAFGVPVILNAELVEGSFRAAAHANGIGVLLFEAGEALRFDEVAIRAGVRGLLEVMAELGMRGKTRKQRKVEAMIANTSRWVRAAQSGILRSLVATGSRVEVDDVLAYISDPLGENNEQLVSPVDGIIIGKTNLPLVFAGEAIFNIASYEEIDQVAENIDAYHEELDPSTDYLKSDEPPLT
jgi:predicted deacylase